MVDNVLQPLLSTTDAVIRTGVSSDSVNVIGCPPFRVIVGIVGATLLTTKEELEPCVVPVAGVFNVSTTYTYALFVPATVGTGTE